MASTNVEENVRSFRCVYCYMNDPNHFCVSKVSHHKEKKLLSDWIVPEKAEGNDGKIYALISPRRWYKQTSPLSLNDIDTCQYVLTGDRRKKFYRSDGSSYYAAVSDNNSVLAMKYILHSSSLSESEQDALQSRWLKSIVNQHTNRKHYNETDCAARVKALRNELLIVRHLHKNEQRLVDGAGLSPVSTGREIVIRMSKAMVDFHDNDNSATVLLGESSVMDAVAHSTTKALQTINATAHGTYSDRASGMIAIPLSSVLHESKESLLEIVIEKLQQDPDLGPLVEPFRQESKIQLRKHLLNLLKDWKPVVDASVDSPEDNLFGSGQGLSPLRSISECSVLLPVYVFPDVCEIDLAGGKRSLGETPLECALRELREETTLDLSNAVVRGSAQNDISTLDFDWLLAQHFFASYNFYFFFHQSMRVPLL